MSSKKPKRKAVENKPSSDKKVDKAKVKKIVKITLNVLTYVFFALCVFTLILTISAKKNDGAASLFGKQLRIVLSDSMASCEQTDVSQFEIQDIPVKSMVFIEEVPEDEAEAKEWYKELNIGDVLTFRYQVVVSQETITHRIINITEKQTGGYIIELAGDNKTSETGVLTQTIDTSLENSPNYVIGKVTGQSKFLGLFLTATKSTVGIICIVIVPCIIIATLEVLKLVSVLGSDKKKRHKEEVAKKDKELEEMRKRIELLERQNEKTNTKPDSEEQKKVEESVKADSQEQTKPDSDKKQETEK